MFHTKTSSESTFPFETSVNLNQNAHDIDDHDQSLPRLVQSSTDLYLSLQGETCPRINRAIRIESALVTTDYSHLLNHSIKYPSRSIMNINMNRTIDLIKRNGAGDENLSSQFNHKQIQTSITTDQNHYLTLEPVPIRNRSRISLTSKQLLLLSITLFVFVMLLCFVAIIFIV